MTPNKEFLKFWGTVQPRFFPVFWDELDRTIIDAEESFKVFSLTSGPQQTSVRGLSDVSCHLNFGEGLTFGKRDHTRLSQPGRKIHICNVWILRRAIPPLMLDLCDLALKFKAREAKGYSLRTGRVSQMGFVCWLCLREKLLYFPGCSCRINLRFSLTRNLVISVKQPQMVPLCFGWKVNWRVHAQVCTVFQARTYQS